MKIYRYEKSDGGGPWFTLEGIDRKNNKQLECADEYLCGCDSLEYLEHYFIHQEFMKEECELKVYEVPDDKVIYIHHTHVIMFPKKFREEIN